MQIMFPEGRGEVLRFRLSTFNFPTLNCRCLRQPVILFRRNNFASATSVSLFPRERTRDMTSERFALVKMSAIA
jgi:hypothetical protein